MSNQTQNRSSGLGEIRVRGYKGILYQVEDSVISADRDSIIVNGQRHEIDERVTEEHLKLLQDQWEKNVETMREIDAQAMFWLVVSTALGGFLGWVMFQIISGAPNASVHPVIDVAADGFMIFAAFAVGFSLIATPAMTVVNAKSQVLLNQRLWIQVPGIEELKDPEFYHRERRANKAKAAGGSRNELDWKYGDF